MVWHIQVRRLLPDGRRLKIGEIAVTDVWQQGDRVILMNEDGSSGFMLGTLGSRLNPDWAGEIILPN